MFFNKHARDKLVLLTDYVLGYPAHDVVTGVLFGCLQFYHTVNNARVTVPRYFVGVVGKHRGHIGHMAQILYEYTPSACGRQNGGNRQFGDALAYQLHDALEAQELKGSIKGVRYRGIVQKPIQEAAGAFSNDFTAPHHQVTPAQVVYLLHQLAVFAVISPIPVQGFITGQKDMQGVRMVIGESVGTHHDITEVKKVCISFWVIIPVLKARDGIIYHHIIDAAGTRVTLGCDFGVVPHLFETSRKGKAQFSVRSEEYFHNVLDVVMNR